MARGKFVTEVLKELNDDINLFNTDYKKVGNGGPLGILFKHAFTAEGKFLLPEGAPPFKESAEPQGMTPANFQMEINKFYVFCRKDLTATKRETMFIQTLEALHPTEAKVLMAIKEQDLPSLYPNLTYDVIANAGFIPVLTPVEKKDEVAQVKK